MNNPSFIDNCSYKLVVLLKNKKETITIHIRELSSEEFIRFDKARNSLYFLEKKLMFFRILYWNYRDMKKCEKFYNNQVVNKNSFDEDELYFNIIRYIHNYLSSVNLFLNHCEANIKRTCPNLLNEFVEYKRDLHSKNVSYKLIYELRNELQHGMVPSMSVKFIKGENNYFNMKIYIKKSYLLSIDNLKKYDDVKLLDDDINLFEHIFIMNDCLIGLLNFIFLHYLDYIYDDYIFLKELLDEIYIEGEPVIEIKNDYNKVSHKPFNLKLFDIIKDFVESGDFNFNNSFFGDIK